MKIVVDMLHESPPGKVDIVILGSKSGALGLLLLAAENLAKEIGLDLMTAAYMVVHSEDLAEKVTLQ